MKYRSRIRANRARYAPRREASMFDRLWIVAFLFALLLVAVGCGSEDDKKPAQNSAGNQGQQGGAAGLTAAGAGGSDKTGSVGGSSSSVGGSRANGGTTAGSGAKAGTGDAAGSNQAGASGASGASGSAGAAGGAGTAAGKRACRTKGSQLVLIGDSYINWITHTFPEDMNKVVGEPVRNYAVGGYSMASGGLGLIPPEIDQALADDPDIIAVVMDGGGNDILIPDTVQFPQGGGCKDDENSASIPDCQAMVKLAVDTAVESMDKLVTAKIPDVVYFFYPPVPSTWLASAPNGILAYARPLAKEACDSAFKRTQGKLNCYFLDLSPVFEGHPEYFADEDLHENSAGSAAMAKAIWKLMVDNCIAQPESSGCCTP
jgi:hypothetical protein